MFYRNRTNFEIIFYTLRGILTKNKQTYVCNRPDFLFADFTASSLLERIVLSGSDFAYSLYGVFKGLLGQCISVTYPRRTAREKVALTPWSAWAARNDEALAFRT